MGELETRELARWWDKWGVMGAFEWIFCADVNAMQMHRYRDGWRLTNLGGFYLRQIFLVPS